jgi:hypothetical protein
MKINKNEKLISYIIFRKLMIICKQCKKNVEPDTKKNGSLYKSCKQCRQKYKCEHNKERSKCKDCKGGSICEHDRIRSSCKDCGGSQICEHDRIRSQCKDCGGSQICEHDRIRSKCKDCGGSQICEHNKRRSQCKDCGGGSICEHDRIRSQCKDCGGSQICEHNRIRSKCKDCGGSQICEHNKRRSVCKDCGGSQICEHNKQHSQCYICNPKRACQHCKHKYVPLKYRFHPYCLDCYCVLNPNVEIPRKYKLKEHHLLEALKTEFKDIEMVFDKSTGESRKRPDVLIDCKTHCIVIECDENQHKSYDCENRRTMEIFQDLGNRPLVLIRFNPDSYVENSGKKIPSCFSMTKTVGWKVDKKEWERRIPEVINRIKYFINKVPSKEVFDMKLFYDKYTYNSI